MGRIGDESMEDIINSYPGDKLIPELYLIDYLHNYEGLWLDSACSSVNLFFGHFYIQKCVIDISIPDAINQLSDFFDYLVEKGQISATDCAMAKETMKKNKSRWVKQEKDWLKMDYDEYNEKYWGI